MIHKSYNAPMIKNSYLEYIKNFYQIIRKGKIKKNLAKTIRNFSKEIFEWQINM